MNKQDYYFNLMLGDIKYLEDKDKMMRDYIAYFLNRLCSMFKYDNLPDTIPAKYLDLYTMYNGCSLFYKHNDKYYVSYGGLSGYPDEYYQPTEFTVANPYLELYKTFKIDKDSVLIRNDALMVGVMPLLKRYCALMVENVVSMRMEIINTRIPFIIGASDDGTLESANLFMKKIVEGKLSVIGESKFLEDLKVLNTRTAQSSNLTNLIEEQQYLKASLYNELGLNANYNMKRESINSNESQLNDDMLTPLIDDMLYERELAIDKINELFGLDIKVSFNSAWQENEEEHELVLDNLENDAVDTEDSIDNLMVHDDASDKEDTEDKEDKKDDEETK